MLQVSKRISIPDNEIELEAVRAQGAGGQNVNKVNSAIHLRFDIESSSLPELYKKRLLKLSDHRISKNGVVIIKAQSSRTQERNREEALSRLQQLIKSVLVTKKKRKPTRPSAAARRRRLENKRRRSKKKALRKRVDPSGG